MVTGKLYIGTAESIPPSELIDTTGAGDAFIGAVIYAICSKFSPEKMLPFAANVGREPINLWFIVEPMADRGERAMNVLWDLEALSLWIQRGLLYELKFGYLERLLILDTMDKKVVSASVLLDSFVKAYGEIITPFYLWEIIGLKHPRLEVYLFTHADDEEFRTAWEDMDCESCGGIMNFAWLLQRNYLSMLCGMIPVYLLRIGILVL
ncbi:ribokinase-like [Trifolium medium]|uniref:Ribokinase-like n=1 Tax=Trifolium medium TaxID=97028 RepID=A0A392LWM9_9FABA|nr:ribokinase-like [Trifolium medium]